MPEKHTNNEIAGAVADLKKDVKAVQSDVKELLNWMSFEKGRQSSVRSSNGNFNWGEIVKQLLVVMAVAGSIVLAVIQLLAERVK